MTAESGEATPRVDVRPDDPHPDPRRRPGGRRAPGAAPPPAARRTPAAPRWRLSDLPVAGLTRRRIALVLGALVSAWVIVLFAHQVGQASEASARAQAMRTANTAAQANVAALEDELTLIRRQAYIEQQARQYRLGSPRRRSRSRSPTTPRRWPPTPRERRRQAQRHGSSTHAARVVDPPAVRSRRRILPTRPGAGGRRTVAASPPVWTTLWPPAGPPCSWLRVVEDTRSRSSGTPRPAGSMRRSG